MLPFLVLVVLGGLQMGEHIVIQIDGVAPIHQNVIAAKLLEMIVIDLCVGFLLVRRETKHRLDHVQLLLFCLGGGKFVPVTRLALAGERAHKVFSGLAFCKCNTHNKYILSQCL